MPKKSPDPKDEGGEVEIDFHGPFTLDEIAIIEALTGQSYARWFDGVSPEGKLRKAIAWTYARRVNPDADINAHGALMLRAG